MKKIKVTQLEKNNILTFAFVVFFLVLIAYATYAALINTVLINNTYANIEIGGRPVFTVTTTKRDVDSNITLMTNTVNSELYGIADDQGVDIQVALSTNYEDDQATECSYDIVFNWTTDSDHYVKSSGIDSEYVIYGGKLDAYDSTSRENFASEDGIITEQLPDYGSSLTLAHDTIITSGSSIKTFNYYYTTVFFTADGDQTGHLGKNYISKISVENVSCKKSTSADSTEDTTNYLTNIINKNSTIVSLEDDVPSLPEDFSGAVNMDKYGIRYVGANPNNYIYFNCSDYANPSADTCELWRIIGVENIETNMGIVFSAVKITRNDLSGQNFVKNFTDDYPESPTSNYIADTYIKYIDELTSYSLASNFQAYEYSTSYYYREINEKEFFTEYRNYQAVDIVDYMLASGTTSSYSGTYCTKEYDDSKWTASGGCGANNWLAYVNSSSSSNGTSSEYQLLTTAEDLEIEIPSEDSTKQYYVIDSTGLPKIVSGPGYGRSFYYISSSHGISYMNRFEGEGTHLNVRDAYYLSPFVKITGGDGTSSNPYTLDSSLESVMGN